MNLHAERLKRQMRRFLWHWWDDHNQSVGILAWSIVGLLVCAGLWLVYGVLPRR
jgi:uncharacterized BrkB/YihY/UPF0761 family membrane protein